MGGVEGESEVVEEEEEAVVGWGRGAAGRGRVALVLLRREGGEGREEREGGAPSSQGGATQEGL